MTRVTLALSLVSAPMAALLCACAVADTSSRAEESARIETVIQSITISVDLRRFDLLERFYAHEVEADYSSLWGNEPRRVLRADIGDAWAGFIPGFDTTRHDLTDIEVAVAGSLATATADVLASHWLDGDTWTIDGQYLFELEKGPDDWVVTKWTFLLESETGDRGLVDVAEARAKARSR